MTIATFTVPAGSEFAGRTTPIEYHVTISREDGGTFTITYHCEDWVGSMTATREELTDAAHAVQHHAIDTAEALA